MNPQIIEKLSGILKGINDRGLGEELLSDIKSSQIDLALLRNEIKKLRYDFETVVEVAQEISSKSLELELIENYTMNLIMGQFGVFKVGMMRQDDFNSTEFHVTRQKNLKIEDLNFDIGLAKHH